MESISGKLLAAREAKGVSIEQAARDTHISKRYIVALESESFDDFPGEAYFLGFLRSYAAYLGLNSDDVVSLYRNIKLQEQPPPIEELLDRRPPRTIPVVPVLATLVVILLVGGIVALFVTGVISPPVLRRSATTVSDEDAPFLLEEQFVERRFNENSRVAVPVNGAQVVLQFVSIGDRVAIGSEAGIVEFSDGDERLLDISGGGSPDVRVAIRRIYRDEDPPAVVARIDRVLEPSATVAGQQSELDEADRLEIAIGRTTIPQRERAPQVVTRLNNSNQFEVVAEVHGTTVFRYQADDGARDEQVVDGGDRISFAARNLARLWISNAGNISMSVAGAPLELGSQGEVVALVLRRTGVDDAAAVELLPLY